MDNRQGADPKGLEELSERVTQESERLNAISLWVNLLLRGSIWLGLVAQAFRGEWTQRLLPLFQACVSVLLDFAKRIQIQAQDQRTASAIEESRRPRFSLGELDRGVSASTLNAANRILILDYLRTLRGKENLTTEEIHREGFLQELIAGERWPEHLVLQFDPEGDGQMVIALGDPSKAKNVAVMVPGVGTEMAGVRDMLNDAARLRNADNQTSVVTWLGYDSPAGAGAVLHRLPEVLEGAGEARASEGAARLQTFMSGLNLADSQNVSVLGHSYGSIVVMRAAAGGGLPGVANIVTLGSPGSTLFNSVSDLTLSEGQTLYAMGADRDVVTGSFGDVVPGHGRSPGLGMGTVGPSGVILEALTTTRVPTDAGFGGVHLETDAWGDADRDSSGHSQYYAEGTGSLKNVQAVVTGEPTQTRSLQIDDLQGIRRGLRGEIREAIEKL